MQLSDNGIYDLQLFSKFVTFAHKFKLESLHNNLLVNCWNFRPFSDSALQVIEVKVSDILYNAKFPFDIEGNKAVSGIGRGAWDKMTVDLEQKALQKSISLRFRKGLPWDQTPQYKKSLRALKRGDATWNKCTSLAELQRRCDDIDALYDDMKQNGYVTSLTPVWDRRIRETEIPDLTTVAMDRNGRLIRCEGGRHRLAIAKLIGIESVPVVLILKHADCQKSYTPLSTIPC